MDSIVKGGLWTNAMDASQSRFYRLQAAPEALYLNGFGAVFANSLWFASSFRIFMEKHFDKGVIDFDHLTPEQIEYGNECFGYSASNRELLANQAFNASCAYRRYIMDHNHRRFSDHMNYADSLSAYRWRTHNASFRTMDHNCIFLYSLLVLEAARQLTPELRQEGKLYFNMMWQLDKEFTMITLENHTLNPILFKEYPTADRGQLRSTSLTTGGVVSETQISFFDNLLSLFGAKLD